MPDLSPASSSSLPLFNNDSYFASSISSGNWMMQYCSTYIQYQNCLSRTQISGLAALIGSPLPPSSSDRSLACPAPYLARPATNGRTDIRTDRRAWTDAKKVYAAEKKESGTLILSDFLLGCMHAHAYGAIQSTSFRLSIYRDVVADAVLRAYISGKSV